MVQLKMQDQPAGGTGEPAASEAPPEGTRWNRLACRRHRRTSCSIPTPQNTTSAAASLAGGGTGGTAATPQMNGSWQLENAHPQGPDDLSDLDTVQSFEIINESDL